MKNRLSTQPKLSTEQLKTIAKIALKAQEAREILNEISNKKIATELGTSKQLLQYHINKLRKEKGGK